MLFNELSEKIVAITDKVEQLIDSENEEPCEKLLIQRQTYLVELAEYITVEQSRSSDKKITSDYHDLLLSIQQRDTDYTSRLNFQKGQVLKDLKQQVNGSKAVSAYKKVIID